jgi:hypothetical protein
MALIHRYDVAALLLPAGAPGDAPETRLAMRAGLARIALPEPGWLAYRVGPEGGSR